MEKTTRKRLTDIEIAESIERLRLSGYCGGDKVRTSIFDSRSLMRDVMDYIVPGYVWREEYGQIADWLFENRGRGLLVMGPCGTGKSLLCGKVIPILLQKAMRKICAMYTAREMNTKYDEISRQKIAYIDDVGTETMATEWGEKRWAFSDIVDDAERRDNLLIMTTNLDVEHLAQRYGDRTVDRLSGMTRLVMFGGSSLRGYSSLTKIKK